MYIHQIGLNIVKFHAFPPRIKNSKYVYTKKFLKTMFGKPIASLLCLENKRKLQATSVVIHRLHFFGHNFRQFTLIYIKFETNK